MDKAWLAFLGPALGVALCGWPVRRLLIRWQVIDRPNERSSHEHPTARGGGIGFVAIILLSAILLLGQGGADRPLAFLCTAGGLLALVSFVDDLKSLPVVVRFGCHAAAALSALWALDWPSLWIGLGPEDGLRLPWLLGLLVMFLWITGYTNAFNFMDGINGIAGGQAAVTAGGSALLVGLASEQWGSTPVLFALTVAGAAAGFLPHNFPRARMFMGDVGSAPLGFLLAVLVIWSARDHGWWLLLPLALLHANFVLDTAITLLRRILRGESWYHAHREHFYQRLIRSGKSHAYVTLWEMGLQVGVLGALVLYLHVGAAARIGLIGLVLGLWATFFTYCEFTFRKAITAEPARAATLPTIWPQS